MRQSVWKGALAGAVGGLVASWTMNRFQAALARATTPAGQSGASSEDENATVKAASAISRQVLDRDLTDEEKRTAAPVVHYIFGSTIGALYGVAAEFAPATSSAAGLPFGGALWLGADEVAVPAFGWSKGPSAYPVSTHASALASHLVYGVTLDLVRRAMRTLTA
jgi:putative membrane protein